MLAQKEKKRFNTDYLDIISTLPVRVKCIFLHKKLNSVAEHQIIRCCYM